MSHQPLILRLTGQIRLPIKVTPFHVLRLLILCCSLLQISPI
uniref:Uncharacterized protein n=1 Tax=Arundo donax TaxID=35708 RepID=A0A0A9EIM1_ARUDO